MHVKLVLERCVISVPLVTKIEGRRLYNSSPRCGLSCSVVLFNAAARVYR